MRQSLSLRALVVRSALLGLVAVAALSGALWATSLISRIGIISLGSSTELFIRNGGAEIRHRYEYDIAPSVPKDQWFSTAVSRGWVNPPPRPGGATSFGFSSGHVMGVGGTQLVSPARYWLLHAPLWAGMVPGILAGTWLVAQWHRKRQVRRRGFSVVMNARSPHNPPMQRTGGSSILRFVGRLCAGR